MSVLVFSVSWSLSENILFGFSAFIGLLVGCACHPALQNAYHPATVPGVGRRARHMQAPAAPRSARRGPQANWACRLSPEVAAGSLWGWWRMEPGEYLKAGDAGEGTDRVVSGPILGQCKQASWLSLYWK